MRIEQVTKLNSGLYDVLVKDNDKEFSFRLSMDIIISHNLYKDRIISDELFRELDSLANYSRIYNATLKYLNFKMRTEYEVREYLKDKGCSLSSAEEIIEKLKRLRFIDDRLFCELYVKQQLEINRKGPLLIKEELGNKKVDISIIEEYLSSITVEMLTDNINCIIKNYVKINKSKAVRKLKETIMRNLISKGYPYEIILSIVNVYPFENQNNDETLVNKEIQKLLIKYDLKYKGLELKNKIIKTLMNKGFNYNDIIGVLNELDLEG